MTVFQLSVGRNEHWAAWLVALGAALALLGCGAQKEATYAIPRATAPTAPEVFIRPLVVADSGTTDTGARSPAASSPMPSAATLRPEAGNFALELAGTSIDGNRRFAVLKRTGEGVITVRLGDEVDGYTIIRIEPERVYVRSPGNGEQIVMLGDATGTAGDFLKRGSGASPESVVNTGLITEGINTDQSIPERVVFGPTGSLPDGVKQVGH